MRALSHPPSLVEIYHLPRALNIHAPAAQSDILATFASSGGPTRCIVLDQGSRPGPPLLPLDSGCEVLILDHHLCDVFPEGAQVLSACHALPVATTSLLAYELAAQLVPSLRGSRPASMAALVGVYGDLGGSKIKFGVESEGPWHASLAPVEKQLTKSALGKAVALLNAPRRTPQFNVADAYAALHAAVVGEGDEDVEGKGGLGLKHVLQDDKLLEAKERTSAETSRWQGAPPVFSKDGKIAVVTVDSGYQSASACPSPPPRRAASAPSARASPLSLLRAVTDAHPCPCSSSCHCYEVVRHSAQGKDARVRDGASRTSRPSSRSSSRSPSLYSSYFALDVTKDLS